MPSARSVRRSARSSRPRETTRQRGERGVASGRRTSPRSGRRACAPPHGYLLAEDGAHRDLEAVERAGHAQARRGASPARRAPRDSARIAREIEQRACTRDEHRRNARARATATPRRAARPRRRWRDLDPADVSRAAMRDARPCARTASSSTASTPAIARAPRNAQHRLPVVGRAVARARTRARPAAAPAPRASRSRPGAIR